MNRTRRAATLLALALVLPAGAAACSSCRSGPSDGEGEPAADDRQRTPDGRFALPYLDDHHPDLVPLLRSKLNELGEAFAPVVVHRGPEGAPRYTNRLVLERSRFLRDHTHQPVDWLPWGRDALRIAKFRGQPMLVYVGDSSCHPCRARLAEVFEDEALAAFVNTWFVPVMVDRWERPDVDGLYQAAAERMGSEPGWPLLAILTPHGDPLFTGVDLPARDADGREGIATVIRRVQQRWESDRAAFRDEAEEVTKALRTDAMAALRPTVPGPETVHAGFAAIATGFDPTHGGFGEGAKRPMPSRLDFLLRYWRRTGEPRALEMVQATLRAMANGGVHDPVGGGFHRRAVDAAWRVPRFEKTVFDNALLARLALDVALATAEARGLAGERPRLRAEPAFDATDGLWSPADLAWSTLAFLDGTLRSDEHIYRVATSADGVGPDGSRGEGAPYTWTPDALAAALEAQGPDAARVMAALFGVDAEGDVDGRSVLRWVPGAARLEQALADGPMDVEGFRAALGALAEARAERPGPSVDPLEIVAGNALAVSALARAAGTRRDRLLAATLTTAFVVGHAQGRFRRLARGFFEGERLEAGFLEDYAYLIEALLDLYEATGELQWLSEAKRHQAWLEEHFAEASRVGAYHQTADYHDELAVRVRPLDDGAAPSGNGVAAMNLLRLADLTGDVTYREAAERVLEAFADALRGDPARSPSMLAALERFHGTTPRIVLAYPEGTSWRGGATERADEAALQQAIQAAYLPNRALHLVVGTPSDAHVEAVPLLRGKVARGGRPTAWICDGDRCAPPTSDPAEALRRIAALRRPLPQAE